MQYREGKLKQENQWEFLSYKFDGEFIDPAKIKQLRVRWPNGSISDVPAVAEERSVDYPDMGHTYTATSKHLFAKVEINGMKQLIPFKKLDVVGIHVI